MKIAGMLLCAMLVPVCTAAQDSPETQEGVPVPSWGKAVIGSFDKPIHPVIGAVASGGGLGFGVGYDSPDTRQWFQDVEAMVTVRRFWSLDAEIGRRSSSKRSQIGVFGGIRDMNRIEFFGLGPDASFDNRSAFTLRESTFGTRGWFRPVAAVRVGGSLSVYLPDLGPGKHPTVPSIEQVFAESAVPGLTAEPTFGRYRGFVEYRHPASPDMPFDADIAGYGGAYQLALEAVRDHQSGRYDFHRWEADVQQRIPGLMKDQRLTLHGFAAATNSYADVPFYMLYTLGGAGGLKSFRPDLLGSDGTRATLRGFRSYRFRDRNLLLMQAEYRIPIHRRVHATVFVDAGQVAPRISELVDHLRTTTGFSLSYTRRGKTLGRMDVGFGGGEGVHLSWTVGGFLN